MSFSSLPPELVHQIIESTVPHTFHSTTYQERQSTLCSLSLVSRLFRSIAQPLLFKIVKLRVLSEAKHFLAARNARAGRLLERHVVTLVIWSDDTEDGDEVREQDGEIFESLEVFAAVRSITLGDMGNRASQQSLPMTSRHLTSLALSDCFWKEPSERLYLPDLRDLSLCDVSCQLLIALVDPHTVPHLRNFAFGNGKAQLNDLRRSKLDRLLPQLETLYFIANLWIDPRSVYLHSAASRSLVDFSLWDTERLDLSTAHLVHVRLEDSSPHYNGFDSVDLQAHLEKWSTLVRTSPPLSLKSIYLDSSLQLLDAHPTSTLNSLNSLVQVCQERKIDIVFETVPVYYYSDPSISAEFVERQKEHRRREAGVKVAVYRR
ncbi:hypothetical protein JCM3765_003500 [Sporobolomyces pararoseus]